ncbi:MAG: hypothetical protein V2I27_15520 [Erythrobacter sp.]|nr:hypothetical protein [Erythrobacter sp.]
MRTRLALPIVALLAAPALAAPPGSGEAPPNDEILVEGSREGDDKTPVARAYLEAVEFGFLDLQTARWEDKICPKVLGVEGLAAQMLVERLSQVAASVGVEVASADCRPNISVVFTEDAADFMATIRRRSPRRLREAPARQRDFLYASQAPVRWWYSTQLFGSGGRALTPSEPPFIQCQGDCSGGSAIPSGPNTKFLSHYSSSRIAAPTERHIKAASVVVDINLAAGTPITALADYVALVALAEIWPREGASVGDSILGLFEAMPVSLERPPQLSETDEVFLCGLYKMPLDRPARYQRGRLISAIAKGDYDCGKMPPSQ